MKLRLSSLDPAATKVSLQELFEKYGAVVSVKIFRDVKTSIPTLAFVEMKREKEAELALKKLNGFMLADTKLKVEWSYDRVTSPQNAMRPPVPLPDDDDEDDDLSDILDDESDGDKIQEVSLDEVDTDRY